MNATPAFVDVTEDDLRELFDGADYVADDTIRTTVLLALRLEKPLLVEGRRGAGRPSSRRCSRAGSTPTSSACSATRA